MRWKERKLATCIRCFLRKCILNGLLCTYVPTPTFARMIRKKRGSYWCNSYYLWIIQQLWNGDLNFRCLHWKNHEVSASWITKLLMQLIIFIKKKQISLILVIRSMSSFNFQNQFNFYIYLNLGFSDLNPLLHLL